jgi:hypothetical protein
MIPGRPPAASQPSTGDPDIGEGGEIARIIGSASLQLVVSPFYQFLNAPIMFHPNGVSPDIDPRIGNVKAGERGRVSDLLEGSSKYVQKCSLNDVIVLVMLIFIKSTSEQSESRFEGMMAKRNISAKRQLRSMN